MKINLAALTGVRRFNTFGNTINLRNTMMAMGKEQIR